MSPPLSRERAGIPPCAPPPEPGGVSPREGEGTGGGLRRETAVWVRWLRHLAAGGVGTLLYLAAVAIGVELLGFHPVASVSVAFTLLVAFSYTVNRTWVYAPERGHGYAIPRFFVGVAIGFLLNIGIMYGMVEVLDLWYAWGLVGAAVVVPPTNFLVNYLWAFR